MDFNNWRRLPYIEKVCRYKKIIELVTTLTNSKKCWLFHDHVLVKNNKAISTPVHHDRPYHIFKGDLNCSIWMPVDKIKRESSLVFYKGTHKLDKLFLPKDFSNGKDIVKNNMNYFTSLDDFNLSSFDAIDFEMNIGDVIVFFNNCLHGSHIHNSTFQRRALSVRYLLDGATMTKKYINATPPFDKMGLKIEEDSLVPELRFPLLRS